MTQTTDNAPPGKRVCFSYVRFSSSKQARGHSEARQNEIAPRVAREKGWFLDESLCMADLGLSAYKKANLVKGSIQPILDGVSSGKIPAGAVMIIEHFDRLTRTDIDESVPLLWSLLGSGLEIYIDRTNRHLTKASLKSAVEITMALWELKGAHEYSAKISDRVGKAWENKRKKLADGHRLTKKIPGWIDAASWKVIPGRVAVVRKIFKLYLDGYGISAIVKLLNGERVPTWGGKRLEKASDWNSSYISQLLHSRAVIGEFQAHKTVTAEKGTYYKRVAMGEPLVGYYPPIVSKEIFFQVQARLGDGTKTRKTEAIRNLFSGLAYCVCGGRMYLASTGKGRSYYMCWSKLKGLRCKQPSVPYKALEDSFAHCFHVAPQRLFRRADNNADEREIIRGKLASLQTQIGNITKFVVAGKATVALVEKQAELESESDELKRALEMAEMTQTDVGHDASEMEFIINNLGSMESNQELRRRIRGWLLSNVKRIVCGNSAKQVDVLFRNGHSLRFVFSADFGAAQIGKDLVVLNDAGPKPSRIAKRRVKFAVKKTLAAR